MSVGDRGQRQGHRLQIRRESRIGQRDEVHRSGPAVHLHGEPVRLGQDLGAGPGQPFQRGCQVGRIDPANGDRAPGDRGRIGPGAADHPVTHRVMPGGMQRLDPSMVIVLVPAPAMTAPISTSMAARSEISGSRAAFSMTVVPLARTAAIRMFSVAPTLGKSNAMSAPSSESASPTTAPCSISMRGAECPQPVLVHVQRSGSDGIATGQRNPGPTTPPHQGPEHTHRRPQLADRGEVRGVRQLGRRGDDDLVTGQLDLAAEAAQHVGHQRYVEDLRTVRNHRGAFGQQVPRPSA